MCGIVGIAGKLEYVQRDSFKDMLRVSTVRGDDATGVLKVRATDNELSYLKLARHAIDFFDLKDSDQAMNPFGSKVVLGHTRSATVGNNKSNNAHPFIIEDDDGNNLIGGVHNGTLRGNWRTTLTDANKFEVDSEALFHNIAHFGVKEVLPTIEGAWALVWFDKRDQTLNMIRNKERTLFLATTEDDKAILWASEDWMLLVAERRGKFKLKRDKEGNFCHLIVSDHLYRITINPTAKAGEDVLYLAPLQKIEGKPYQAPVSRMGWGRGDFDDGHSIGGYVAPKSKGGSSVTNPFQKEGNGSQEKNGESGDELDDNIPPFLLNSLTANKDSRAESGTTQTSSSTTKKSLTSSAPTSSLTIGERPKLSLVKTNSNNSLPDNKGGRLNNSENVYGFSMGVREVVGTKYITFTNKDEMSEEIFFNTYGNNCCFCQNPVDITEVNTILPHEQGYICTSCAHPNHVAIN